MNPRTFDEHLPLLTRFAGLADTLTPDAWARLRARCATLDGESLDAIIDRARLFAASQQRLPQMSNAPFIVRALGAMTWLTMATTAVTYQTIGTLSPATPHAQKVRRTSTGSPRADCYIDAMYLIDRALERHGMRRGGVVAAVRSAASAVLHHDRIPKEEFFEVYRWVETEIPYRLVDAHDEHSAARPS